MQKIKIFLFVLITMSDPSAIIFAANTQQRINNDIAAGKPIVIQVSVALADNQNQLIVPVPDSIGNGQNARTNLYWGARYGIKTYMIRDGGWEKVTSFRPSDNRILERLVLQRRFLRDGHAVQVYLIADAWNGKYIKSTIENFLNYSSGNDVFDLQLKDKKIAAGGKAHLIVYIGHNALMDYGGVANLFISNPKSESNRPPNDAIVLACKSQPYFLTRLKEAGANPLLLTTGLMAPEAYSLHAAIKHWIAGDGVIQIRKAAAESYNKYQRTGRNAAERLFGVDKSPYSLSRAASHGRENLCYYIPLLEKYEAAGMVQHTPEGKIILRLVADLHYADCGAPDCYGTKIIISMKPLTKGDGCLIEDIAVITEDFWGKGCMDFKPAEPIRETYIIEGDPGTLGELKTERVTLRNMDQSRAIIIMRDNFFYFNDVSPNGALHTRLQSEADDKGCCWGATSSKLRINNAVN